MIIYIREEHAYRTWVTHHRQGFVLDGRLKPQFGHFSLHRAGCPSIKASETKATSWTTDGRVKCCSLHREELENWVKAENGLALDCCPICRPEDEPHETEHGSRHIYHMGNDVMDYIFESALTHLESPEGPPYRLNVADIASCLGTSAGQLTPTLKALLENGSISLPGINEIDAMLPPGRLVLPTPQALQTLPAFANESAAQLQVQLDTLLVERS